MVKKLSIALLVVLGMVIFSYVTTSEETVGVLNINAADVSDFQMFSDIDLQTASNIVTFRNTNGPFSSIEDLLMVSGITEKTFSKIRDNLVIEGESTLYIKGIHSGMSN